MIPTINKTPDISMLTAVTVGSLCPAYTIIYFWRGVGIFRRRGLELSRGIFNAPMGLSYISNDGNDGLRLKIGLTY
jgi:hypothetical protein